MSGCCVVVIVKGYSILEIKFWLQVGDFIQRGVWAGLGALALTDGCMPL